MVESHAHNGIDNQEIDFRDLDLSAVKQAAIADPSGGATQDAEARAAINSIIDALQSIGLLS